MLTAMRDGGELVRWAEPNTIALNDERAENAILAALSARSADGLDMGQPMLRPCDPDRLATPLIDAIANDRREHRTQCDRCGSNARPEHYLWVPSGATVAELACCFHCRNVLDDLSSDLVWR